jgi:hypothetical protein
MGRVTHVRYGKVVPNPNVKFSTIKVELEAEVEESEDPYDVKNVLRAAVRDMIKEEG